ncbi:MAG TPA: glutaminyl-peptide cyclotransferase [Bacteroidales bacterium]|nr:glutaminyl-peptide cyclotransferase [Bacteroidales bacterium]
MSKFPVQYSLFFVTIFFLFSCTQNNKTDTKQTIIHKKNIELNNVRFKMNRGNMLFKLADTLHGKFSFPNAILPDSILLFIDGHKYGKLNFKDSLFLFYTGNQTSGNHTLMFLSYFSGQKEIDTYHYTLLSNIQPKEIKWEIKKIYPHDSHAYTQGLFFKNSYLYESTGQWGQSSLRKIDLTKNEIIKTYNLSHDIFGEGIVAYKNKIIWLTWQSHEAFEFDMETFELIRRFTYDTEGWGITNYKDNLLMSDGSNLLYIVDPTSFAIIDKIQVYDNVGPVKNLNELENINGMIFANVYQTDNIVVINPKTGIVIANINLKGLLPDEARNKETDVLNGIAWDKSKEIFLVTGKNWPYMYQLSLSNFDLHKTIKN